MQRRGFREPLGEHQVKRAALHGLIGHERRQLGGAETDLGGGYKAVSPSSARWPRKAVWTGSRSFEKTYSTVSAVRGEKWVRQRG